MRTLEQCKAEVFRRSEEKIRKRKVVRRYVIAACLPLCLFVSFWAVMILPAMMPAKSADSTAENAAPMEFYNDTEKEMSTSTATVAVVVAGETHPVAGEDAFAAAAFLSKLEYSPAKVCKCLPQFRVITDSGEYGIHLGEGYARCDRGQARLTQEQMNILQSLLYAAVPDWTPVQKNS